MHQVPVGTSSSRLRIGTAPVNWNNTDIPNWRPFTPFPEILDRMRAAGYTATEYNEALGDDPEVLNREIAARDMVWTGSYQWVDFLDTGALPAVIALFTPLFELLANIDCRHLIVSDILRPHRVALAGRIPTDGSASLPDDLVHTLVSGVHALAAAASRHGIALHYHNHVGTWIEAPHEVDAFIRHLDFSSADICFDTGHYAYGGGDPARFIEDYVDQIGYLHLKDVDAVAVTAAREQGLTFLDALRTIVFSPIGTGSADIPAILDRLTSADFDGWVIIEQDTCAGDATETARDNLHFITNWLSEHAPDARTRR